LKMNKMNDERAQNEHFHEPPMRTDGSRTAAKMNDENEVIIPQENEAQPQTAEISVDEAKRIIEAILFASGEPVKYSVLASVLGYPVDVVGRLAAEMEYMYEGRGIMLLRLGDSCQLVSRENYIGYIRQALNIRTGGSLSNTALEVLAIVAYHQPVTKAYIEQIRGTDSGYALNQLVERGLVEISGKLEVPGRPNLYRTTADFLRAFGLGTIGDLPALEL